MTKDTMEMLICELKDSNKYLRDDNHSLRIQLERNTEELSAIRRLLANANEELSYFRKMLFGTSSEKKHIPDIDGQLNMFACLGLNAPSPFDTIESDEIIIQEHIRKAKTKLKDKLDHLPHKEEIHVINEADRFCDVCGTELEIIGKEFIRQEVIFHKPELVVVKHFANKYACPNCKVNGIETRVIKAPVPTGLMKHTFASPSIVAEVIYQKMANCVPTYRQEKDWQQYGLELSRATMANWIINCTKLYFTSIYDLCHKLLLQRSFAMADETRLQVLNEKERRAQTDSYMWLFRSGEDDKPPIILYKYHETRAGGHAEDFMNGFTGYIMTDGYQGYNKLHDMKRCCCYAHLRRYFIDAIPADYKNDMNNPAVQGREYCDKLFSYERRFKQQGYTPDQKKEMRLKKEKPILEAFLSWADMQLPRKGSRLAKAITYLQNRRDYMMTYLLDGHCSLSNNLSEQEMKAFVIGRKNWLFSNSTDGADALAICYSLCEMAKANGINIYKYLEFLLNVRPSGNMSNEELENYLPWSEQVKHICAI
ncbi:IS66 family transposase [Clostridium sp. KNHs205]|uniref:IS66 family transposase n=1 Tax=Clostridium sp. KNHs205 TaxID=1449050 RepID=UPI00051C4129|nr:IS66 family transposase [Clostridium sp. KNHs205]